jgi:hypothetical protein
VGKRKATSEVDHVVSFALWKTKLQSGLPKQIADEEEAESVANKIGNCALLEKNFNISKSDKPLKSFLSQIHEVREHKIRIDAWCAALAISQPLLDPDVAGVDDINEAIENRDKEMKADLADFIRGLKVRVDVDTLLSQMPTSVDSASIAEQATEHSAKTEERESSPTEDVIEGSSDEEQGALSGEVVTTPGPGTDLGGLRAAYKEDESVHLIIDHFASRERNQKETQVDRLTTLLERDSATLSRSAIIRAFRRLDILGVGRFIPGRKGHPTRFEWYAKSLSVRGLAEADHPTADQHSGR